MKAVLSNRIFLEVSPELEHYIKDKLTYKIAGYSDDVPPTIIRNYSYVRPGIMSIPIGRIDLIPPTHQIVEKRVLAPTSFPEFLFDLRASQQEVYDNIEDNAIINATVSWGKTFSGLAIAGKLGQKTLVITHTVPLRNQWARETKKVYGFEPGIIGSGRFETDTPIVIANTQTLTKKIPQTSRMFGTVILDEMHHVSSPTVSDIINKSFARYKLGLSGTIQRKDGKHVVFRDFFGNNVIQPPEENKLTPVVHIYKTKISLPGTGVTPWAVRVNNLVANPEYMHLIAMLAAKYSAQGHNVLALSDRVEFLENISKLIGPNAVAITGKVKEEREALIEQVGAKYNILCGIQSIFSEGISHTLLSCLVLGAPVNNEPLLEQLIGRVVRLAPGKQTPVIVDINLSGHTGEKQAQARLGHYIRKGYRMEIIWI